MVLYIQTVYDQGTLLRSRNALVKSKEMAATLTLEAVEKQSCAMGAQVFDIGLFDPNAAAGSDAPASVESRHVASLRFLATLEKR